MQWLHLWIQINEVRFVSLKADVSVKNANIAKLHGVKRGSF